MANPYFSTLNPERMRQYAKRVFLIWVGVVLIAIGLAGLVLPIVPGWILIFFGASLISRNFRRTIIGILRRWRKYLPLSEKYLKRYDAILLKQAARHAKIESALDEFSDR